MCEVTGALLDPAAHHSADNSAHAHHVVPRSKCAALKYDVRNGVLLCRIEHARFHGQGWGSQADESYVWEYMWRERKEDAAHIMRVKREARK